jgi:mannitol-1-phosphate/altronate dehydrogenase
METVQLNQRNLEKIHAPVLVPSYNRERLGPGLVHLGLGNFHRAHQAVYLDRLLTKGITKAGLFEINLVKDPFPLAETAAAQDYLYSKVWFNTPELCSGSNKTIPTKIWY